jgi:hypothetical protein
MVARLHGKLSLPSTVAITGIRSSTLYRGDSDDDDDEVFDADSSDEEDDA